jgi:hypothetical protein
VPHIAAVRGLIEEFSSVGADETNSDLDPNSLLTWDEVIESPSFPNLTTQYHMHQMTATVSNALPSVNFITHEDDGQGRKEHFWEWRLDSPDDKRRKREEERPAGQEIALTRTAKSTLAASPCSRPTCLRKMTRRKPGNP